MTTDSRRVRIIKNLSKRRRRGKFPLYYNDIDTYFERHVTGLTEFLEHLND